MIIADRLARAARTLNARANHLTSVNCSGDQGAQIVITCLCGWSCEIRLPVAAFIPDHQSAATVFAELHEALEMEP